MYGVVFLKEVHQNQYEKVAKLHPFAPGPVVV